MELRRSPLECPITAGTVVIAGALTVAWWTGRDVSRLMMTPEAVGAEPWRLFTSALLHVNVLHLAFNAIWTWTFGSVLETRLGPLRFGLLVLALAAGSGAAELALAGHGVGLSGVGYGLFGFLWAARAMGVEFAEEALPRRTVHLFVAWFFFCIVATHLSWMRVANVAHGAGALLGAVAGALLSPRRGRRVAAGLGLALGLAASFAGAGPLRPHVNITGAAARDTGRDGDEALDAGDATAAAAHYEAALAQAPDDARLWYNLHVAYHRLERFEEAVEAAERAVALAPERETYVHGLADALARLGQARFDAGDEEAALRWYEKARSRAPDVPAHHFRVATMHVRLDRPAQARETLLDAQQRWPEHPRIAAELDALPPP